MFGTALLLTALAGAPADEPAAKTIYKPDLFQTLVDPDCSHCRDEARRKAGTLRDDDRVLAWIRGDYTGGAIPYRWFLVPYRVISDTYGVFVYDADADFIRAWPASLDFRFHGWRNGIMVMKRKDGTLFNCLTGVAYDGPGKGEKLTPLPAVESDWGRWLKDHPGTVAYQMVDKFAPMPVPTTVSLESKQTRPEPDKRAPADLRVFGLSIAGESMAWPLMGFGDTPSVRKVKVGGQEAYILWDPSTKSAGAYAPETEGKNPEKVSLTLDASDKEVPWVDHETGSHWSIVGRATSGSRKDQSLRWLPGVSVKWYAWSAAYPKTDLARVPIYRPAQPQRIGAGDR